MTQSMIPFQARRQMEPELLLQVEVLNAMSINASARTHQVAFLPSSCIASMGVRKMKGLEWQVEVLDGSPEEMEMMSDCIASHKGDGKRKRGCQSFSIQKRAYIHLTWKSETTYTNVWSWLVLALAKDGRCAHLKWSLTLRP